MDDCSGSGDHENFFSNGVDTTTEYLMMDDGKPYSNCIKKAVRYRSKYDHKPPYTVTDAWFWDGTTYFKPETLLQEGFGYGDIFDPKYS